MNNQFYQLKVAQLNKPIEEATTITFEIPDALKSTFQFKPGQHLIIKFIMNGEEARRSYSINSSAISNENLQVTVKRVHKGLVSNYINDSLKEGDTLEVMPPQGMFCVDIAADAYKSYFLFAAGSGITPIISIAKSVLAASPQCYVNLFYGNKNQDTIIFKDELDQLAKQYENRFKVVHTLSEPKVWTTWQQWKGKKGKIDNDAVEWFITNNPPIAQNTEYYICGPNAMNVNIRAKLMELQIPKNLINIEQFGGGNIEEKTNINSVDATAEVVLYGQSHQVNIKAGSTILQALKTASINPPYSCESGICGTCTAKLTKGTAEMKSCMALDDDHLKQGLILTCQALATSPQLKIEY